MPDKLWKAVERRIAAKLGGRRVPITGRQRGDVPDVQHARLSVEVKHRRQLPAWLKDALRQAVAAAKPEQLPVVVLHEHGQRHGEDLVVMSMRSFTQWFGDVPPDKAG